MKIRLFILIGVGAAMVLLVSIVRQGEADHDASFFLFEPRYEGERLNYWMLHLYRYDQTRHIDYSSQDAILHIGTNALPLILDWISRPAPRYFTPGETEYSRHAVDAFEILGPVAKPAIPRLLRNVSKGSRDSMRALEFIGRDAVPPLANKLLETLADKHKPVMNWRDPGYQGNFFHVQECILQGLREMGTNAEAAIPAVKETMYANHGWRWYNGDDPYSTLVSIGQKHPEIVVPALIDVLTNVAAPAENRGAIAQAMGSFGTNYADAMLPVMISAMNDARMDDWNRRTMAGALATVGQSHAGLVVPVLMAAFTNSAVIFRDGIADAFSVLGNDARPALPLLLEASRSRDFRLREEAAIAVKKIAPEIPDSLARLIKDLNNPDPGFRQQAINAIAGLGTNGIEAVPALLKCLSHPDSTTRSDATRALNCMGVTSDEYIEDLGKNLADTNSFVADEARSSLVTLAGHSKLAFVTLIRQGICGQIGGDERSQSKWACINLSRDNPAFMLECLDDPDAIVRSGALSVFYDLARRVPEAVPKLRQMAEKDADLGVRSRAAGVLRLQSQ